MEIALRLGLAAVLVAAGATKLWRPDGFRRSLAAHGVPAGLVPVLLLALPVTEVLLGVTLMLPGAARAAAAAAAALLALFAVSFVRLAAAGQRRTACGCLGGMAERPTWLLALRAALLAGLAVILAAGWNPSPSADALLIGVVALLAVAVVVLGALVLALYRQVGLLHLRLGPRLPLELEHEGPPLAADAPPLPGLARAGSELVVFLSAACSLCRTLRPGVAALAREGLPVRLVDADAERGVVEAWGVPGTPFAVHVVDGVVRAKGLPNTLEELDRLVASGEARSVRVAA